MLFRLEMDRSRPGSAGDEAKAKADSNENTGFPMGQPGLDGIAGYE